MSCYTQKKFVITGQIKDDIEDGNDVPILKAELELICAKYGLSIIEED